jgi:hypothetical protein
MNSSKSGSSTFSRRAEAVEDALSDEGDALVGGHLEPGHQIVVISDVENRHGPGAAAWVANDPRIGARSALHRSSISP